MTNMAVSKRYEWQNKIIRLIFSFFIAIGVIVKTIAPFSMVAADNSATYLVLSAGNPLTFNGVTLSINTGEARVAYMAKNARKWIYIVSDSNNTSQYVRFNVGGNGTSDYMNQTVTVNNVRYNFTYFENTGMPGSWINGALANGLTATPGGHSGEHAVYYTYGAGAVAPPEPIDYGNIKDLSYSTNIVGSGTTTGDANIDTISWFPYWDNNSNISTTWNMQIQVVPGSWEGGTNTDIFSQTYQDFIINESGATDIYRGTYLNGSVSISWGEVKNKLSILSWADLFQYFDGSYWNKKGWVYRARYNDPDSDYWSEWQTIYTVTSSAGEGVENIIDPDDGTGLPDFNNNVQNSYNTTSVVNNNYNVTYYYNGVPVQTNENEEEINDYSEQIYYLTKQIRDILINLNTTNSTTENNDNDETITNNLNSVVDDFHNTENQFMTDMDEKLNEIDRNVELLNDNKFIAAANWVRVQYDNIVSDTPFELLIVFGLVLSLALIIIGKIR